METINKSIILTNHCPERMALDDNRGVLRLPCVSVSPRLCPVYGDLQNCIVRINPDSKVHEACMGPTWGRQDPGGPHVGPWTLLSGKFLILPDVIGLLRLFR